MEKAKVYFTDFRCPVGTNNLQKLQKLCRRAGIDTIDMKGKFVAIKMHFGELGCLASIRPQYVKAVADLVKELGGRPFITDCNTLYPGSRKHALEHMDCANLNGYNTITTGCQIIIGDGLRGTDEVEVPVKNGEYVEKAKIGRAIMDADIVVSLAHFKGHEMTGFGGAIKNIGMGCGSRAGKMEQHSSGKPAVNEELCKGCHRCAKEFNMAMDISPNCDCHGENDAPILPNIGMFASFDPVAIDQACVDACQKETPLPNSQLADNLAKPDWNCHHDHFLDNNPRVNWDETLVHAQKIGLGTRNYELIVIK